MFCYTSVLYFVLLNEIKRVDRKNRKGLEKDRYLLVMRAMGTHGVTRSSRKKTTAERVGETQKGGCTHAEADTLVAQTPGAASGYPVASEDSGSCRLHT